jgi:hypothetical protein
MAYQNRLVRFLENHDEPRAAHDFPAPVHQAAAVITCLTPGLRFFHEGQLEGHRLLPGDFISLTAMSNLIIIYEG